MIAITIEVLQDRVSRSELGREFLQEPLMLQDVWPLAALGYSHEEIEISNRRNLYFTDFHLRWLKLLAKLTVKARIRQRHTLNTVVLATHMLRELDAFLAKRSYTRPEDLSDRSLREFIAERSREQRKSVVVFVTRLWAEEGWLKISFVPQRIEKSTPKIEFIPEEVLHQVYENFDMFPPLLERLFRLQMALGCRIGEMFRMPRACLKQEGEQWFILRWVEKQKKWKFYRAHFLVADLVQEQQRFLDAQFGPDCEIDKLFCWLSTSHGYGSRGKRTSDRFGRQPVYKPEMLNTQIISNWLQAFSLAAGLQDKHGNLFVLQSHMFRRTKASIMAYCEAEDEYIAAVLGHASLDMLPYYRKRSLERLEKESQAKGYVDMYGQITTFKPKKRRYERLVELMKVSTPLGECHRPTMLGDCQYRYACLGCIYHRVTTEDRPELEADRDRLQSDLKQAQAASLTRRKTEINRLLELIENRLRGLDGLQTMLEGHTNE